MLVENTKTLLNLDGANIKELKRIDGKLAVVKHPIQEGLYDTVGEVMYYRLAKFLGVPCCEADFVNGDTNLSYSVIDEGLKNKLISADEFLNTSGSCKVVFERLKQLGVSNICLYQYLQMLALDVTTRQIDRNLTNYSFYFKNMDDYSSVELYPLYDNGLCLFSTGGFKEDLDFRSSDRSTREDFVDLIVSNNYLFAENMSVFFYKVLTVDKLMKIWSGVPLEFDTGVSLESVCNWVIRSYNDLKCEILR